MRRIVFSLIGVISGVEAADLCPGHPGGPTLDTPGSATCVHENVGGTPRTTYTVTGDTILSWDRLEMPAGDELIFDFVGGASVINRLGGTRTHRIDGDVVSNGVLGFFSPQAGISVGGSITAKGVTLATMELADPAAFQSGGDYRLDAVGGLKVMSVDGRVSATDGDVVLAGELVNVSGSAELNASGAVRMAGGRGVDVAGSGMQRLGVDGGSGVVLHLGESRGTTLELVGVKEVTNAGLLEADGGMGKIFLEVGPDGQINNEGTGLILGMPQITGPFDNQGVILEPDEGDSLEPVGSSVLKLPAVRRPDGSEASRQRVIKTAGSMTASSDAVRDRKRDSRRVAKKEGKKSLLRRGSFFGMRGQSR